ncbi:hypothetical protein B0H11DRAFT_2275098 [Mycena galericulata]|nr:hypothetical protein B0H11DRAFT_2275098 [Mycena galericulata]
MQEFAYSEAIGYARIFPRPSIAEVSGCFQDTVIISYLFLLFLYTNDSNAGSVVRALYRPVCTLSPVWHLPAVPVLYFRATKSYQVLRYFHATATSGYQALAESYAVPYNGDLSTWLSQVSGLSGAAALNPRPPNAMLIQTHGLSDGRLTRTDSDDVVDVLKWTANPSAPFLPQNGALCVLFFRIGVPFSNPFSHSQPASTYASIKLAQGDKGLMMAGHAKNKADVKSGAVTQQRRRTDDVRVGLGVDKDNVRVGPYVDKGNVQG